MKSTLLAAIFLLSTFYLCAQTQPVEVSRSAIKELVDEWNNAHNEKNASKFIDLYTNPVRFYGQQYSSYECAMEKRKLFKKHSTFKQKIVSPHLTLSAYPEKDIIKCEFTKEVITEAGAKEYPAILYLKKLGDSYRIAGESDEITDRNLGITYDLGPRRALVDKDNLDSRKDQEEEENATVRETIFGVTLSLLFILLAGYGLVSLYRRIKEQIRSKKQHNTHNTESAWPKSEPGPIANETYRQEHKKKERNWSRVIDAEDAVIVTEKPTLQKEDNTNEEKGYTFEKYIVNKFRSAYFILKEWRGDKRAGTRYAQSSMDPDLYFIFSFKGIEKHFAVECKFRTALFHDAFHIEPEQLQRYREYEAKQKIDVYLALGLGGQPDAPKKMFLVPLKELISLEHSVLAKYEKNVKKDFFMDKDTLILR